MATSTLQPKSEQVKACECRVRGEIQEVQVCRSDSTLQGSIPPGRESSLPWFGGNRVGASLAVCVCSYAMILAGHPGGSGNAGIPVRGWSSCWAPRLPENDLGVSDLPYRAPEPPNSSVTRAPAVEARRADDRRSWGWDFGNILPPPRAIRAEGKGCRKGWADVAPALGVRRGPGGSPCQDGLGGSRP